MRNIIVEFKVLIEVLVVNDKIIKLALISDFKHFEDFI